MGVNSTESRREGEREREKWSPQNILSKMLKKDILFDNFVENNIL